MDERGIPIKNSIEQRNHINSDTYVIDQMAVRNSETTASSKQNDIIGTSPSVFDTNQTKRKRKLCSESNDSDNTTNLVIRLRKLREKRLRKSYSGTSDLKYEEICSSEFIKTVKVLENACNVTGVNKTPQNHPSHLHFKPFSEIEPKNDAYSFANEDKCFNKQQDTEIKLISSTLSFDEDKEDDIFAETKPETNDADFTQGESRQDVSSPYFSGFSQEERISSQNLWKLHNQCSQLENQDDGELDRETEDLFGFTSTDIDFSEITTKIFNFLVEKYCSNDCIGFVKSSGKIRQKKECTPKITNNHSRSNDPKKIEVSADSGKCSMTDEESKIDSSKLKCLITVDCIRVKADIQSTAENDSDLDAVPNSQEPSNLQKSTIAFSRSIKISESALTKAKQLYAELKDVEIPEVQTKPSSSSIKSSNNDIHLGFATAGGQKLKISEEALSKAKSAFSEIEKEFSLHSEKQSEVLLPENKENYGFATAGGRKINISKTALNKAQQVFLKLDDFESTTLITKSLENNDNPIKNKVSVEFSTAGGRQLKVSEEALSKGRSVFSDIENDFAPVCGKQPEATDETISNARDLTPKQKEIVGFATAGGRQINISKTALRKAEQEFSKLEDFDSSELITKSSEKNEKPIKNKVCIGFSTAGGRQLKVSEEALSKGKSVFSDIENDFAPVCGKQPEGIDEAISNIKALTPKQKETVGFATAGGRQINISKTALKKAEQKYSEIDIPETEETFVKTPTITKESSANEINIGISTPVRNLKNLQEALSKSKAAYTHIEDAFLSNTTENKLNTETYVIDTATSTKNNNIKSNISTVDVLPIKDNLEPLEVEIPESLTYEDFLDHSSDEVVPSKKRKCEDIDEDTPLRRDTSLKRKRGRYDNDLQGRKLFIEDSNKETKDEFESKHVNIPESALISEEVNASAAALLEDELRSRETDSWPFCRTHNSEARNQSANPQCFSDRKDPSMHTLKSNHTDIKSGSNNSLNRSYPGAKLVTGVKENNRRAYSDQMKVPQEIEDESIPEDLNFESQFTEELRDSQVMDKFIVETIKIMEGRLAAASKQDEIIRVKRRTKTIPCDGSLFDLRTSNEKSRISWKQWTEGFAPVPREASGNSQERGIFSVTAASAESYNFCCADFYGAKNVRNNVEGVKVGDGASLILDERNCAGAREFERAFLASPGVDPNLIPVGWVRNHYRWIVWKLASLDRVKFNKKTLPRMLTPHRVMLELKYRYDREIYRSQWPPLRRILERNEDASARIVLCVASIITETDENLPIKKPDTPNHLGSPLYKIELTDGWYSISASIDIAMVNCIKSGKVKEGTKLMIFGAKALNLDQGCSVLEIPISVSLRIHTNSTRRARWHTKLDYWRSYRGPMSFSLKSIKPHGGAICKIVVAIARLYPILFREKLSDGECVFRNARCDEEAARAHEARYQSKMEEIYANAWTEFQMGSERKRGSAEKRQHFLTEDTALSSDREEELRERIASKMRECLPPPRDVTPVMKIRIAEGETHAVITIWSVDRDMTETFVEGSTVAIYNAFASGQRSNELHITAGRSTLVKPECSRRISYPERIFTPIMEIGKPGFSPVYGEFDTVGIITSTGAAPHGMKNFETVNIAFPRTENDSPSDFLSILFWQGISTHGYSKILTVGSLVACSNLEWRRNTSRSIPTAYCTERSVFSKIPRQKHLTEPYECLRKRIKDPFAYAAACAAVIEEEIAKKSALRTPGQVTPYRPGTSNNRTPGWSPMASPIDVNSTPKIDSRNTSMRRRIARLEGYGEPPELPSIVLNNSSRKVLSNYRSPVLTPVTKS